MKALLIVAAVAMLVTTVHVAEKWNPQAAAAYLDGRQQQWAEWPRAQSANGACVSCHTGMTYLIARPALRRVLGETEKTKHEAALLARLRTNVGAKPAAALRDVEVIFAALFLAMDDAGKAALGADTEKAFEQLWTLQAREGDAAGTWKWYHADLDPWEMPESTYFGASLAALAVGQTPVAYRNRPDVQANIRRLTQYLTTAAATQPLHNRVALLWASSSLREVLSTTAREALLTEIFKAQASDGSWSMQSLGPWQPHPNAPVSDLQARFKELGATATFQEGRAGGIQQRHSPNANYATAFTTFVLQQAGIRPSDPRLSRALDWLRDRQEVESGSWSGDSMNKQYPDGSMERSFMRDAATAFAASALVAP
jgi:squalene-hopene/tetraprenyl-beta-curcumene cyclase